MKDTEAINIHEEKLWFSNHVEICDFESIVLI